MSTFLNIPNEETKALRHKVQDNQFVKVGTRTVLLNFTQLFSHLLFLCDYNLKTKQGQTK